MQGRSWMAALTLNASALLGLVLGNGMPIASRADDAPPAPAPPSRPAAAEAVAPSTVVLKLDIAGLGPKGCDVEIAPGNMGCRFRPVTFHVDQHDANKGSHRFDDIQAIGDDRYCLFAITIREPGQPVKTVRRGLRLVAPTPEHKSPQLLLCYLNSPSKLARTPEMRDRR